MRKPKEPNVGDSEEVVEVSPPEDRILIQRFLRSGDPRTFQALVERHLPAIRRLLYTLFNGQRGSVQDCSRSPFVVDLKTVVGPMAVAHRPVIRVLEEGTKLDLRATLLDNDRVRLECGAKFSKIGDVDTLTTESSAARVPT